VPQQISHVAALTPLVTAVGRRRAAPRAQRAGCRSGASAGSGRRLMSGTSDAAAGGWGHGTRRRASGPARPRAFRR
jgi:hypothetical protein